ncbi:MAG: DoxX family protein [Acidimicrobiia bacterium]
MDADAINLSLFGIRVMLGVVMFAHGWKHLKSLRSGPGMANWFESLGLHPGPLHAQIVTYVELAAGVALIVGLLTPVAMAAVVGVCLVAVATHHRTHGFFTTNPGEGYEYVVTLTVVALAMGALGPGEWSLDDAFDIVIDGGDGLLVDVIVGIGGTALFLLLFYRPSRATTD